MSLFGKMLKGAVDVATLPVSVAKDVITLGGSIEGKQSTYTGDKIRKISDDCEDFLDSLDK